VVSFLSLLLWCQWWGSGVAVVGQWCGSDGGMVEVVVAAWWQEGHLKTYCIRNSKIFSA
jgi:hypothetical protein